MSIKGEFPLGHHFERLAGQLPLGLLKNFLEFIQTSDDDFRELAAVDEVLEVVLFGSEEAGPEHHR